MAAKLPLVVVEVVVGNGRGSVSESLSAADRDGQEGARGFFSRALHLHLHRPAAKATTTDDESFAWPHHTHGPSPIIYNDLLFV